MNGKVNPTSAVPLARNLRVGLLGSPYDWSDLNFEVSNKNGVSFSLISFVGTQDSKKQDLLLSQSSNSSKKGGIRIIHDEYSLLEIDFSTGLRPIVTPDWLRSAFDVARSKLNERILDSLRHQQEKYVSTESIIARYGTQVLRIGSLLGTQQIHIENDALAYLLETPWRNEQELDFLIALMVYNMDGDVLRKHYVQNTVYEFGTSIRGISNSSAARSMIESFSLDVVTCLDFRTASLLFDVQLDPISLQKQARKSTKPMEQSKRAA